MSRRALATVAGAHQARTSLVQAPAHVVVPGGNPETALKAVGDPATCWRPGLAAGNSRVRAAQLSRTAAGLGCVEPGICGRV